MRRLSPTAKGAQKQRGRAGGRGHVDDALTRTGTVGGQRCALPTANAFDQCRRPPQNLEPSQYTSRHLQRLDAPRASKVRSLQGHTSFGKDSQCSSTQDGVYDLIFRIGGALVELSRAPEGVRAVDRALEILLAFQPGDDELTVAEIRTRVDLSRPTLYRLLGRMALTLASAHDHASRLAGEPARARPSTRDRTWAVVFSFSARCARLDGRPWIEQSRRTGAGNPAWHTGLARPTRSTAARCV